MAQHQGLSAILDQLAARAEGEQKVTGADIQSALGRRSFGPFLLVPALFELTPIGGIPGVPTLFASIIVIAAVQILFGKGHMWLPRFLRERRLRADRVTRAVDWLRPAAGWSDRLFRRRIAWLTQEPFVRVIAAICLVLAFTVPPLELLPFASSVPMAAIALFGLALVAEDGVLACGAIVLSVAALGTVVWAATI